MFYTGVDTLAPDLYSYGNQRIGYATATAIDTGSATVWTQRSSPTYTVNHTGWADRDSTTTGTHRHQFRDPFIMADPDSAGRYLLFMVGQKQNGDYAVGVARNRPGTLDAWQDLGYYRGTEYDYSGNGHVVESVTAFPDSAYPVTRTSAQATWRLLFTHGIDSPADSSIRFSAKKLGPALADTTLGSDEDRVWSTPATNLFTYLAGDSTAWGTYATEYLRAGSVDFLATYDGDVGIRVSTMHWNLTDFTLLQPTVTAVEGEQPGTGIPRGATGGRGYSRRGAAGVRDRHADPGTRAARDLRRGGTARAVVDRRSASGGHDARAMGRKGPGGECSPHWDVLRPAVR